jgi:hypothetical protein
MCKRWSWCLQPSEARMMTISMQLKDSTKVTFKDNFPVNQMCPIPGMSEPIFNHHTIEGVALKRHINLRYQFHNIN